MRHVGASRIGVSVVLVAALVVSALVLAGSSGASFPGRDGRIVFADARADQPGEGHVQIHVLDLASGRTRSLSGSAYDDGDLALSRDGSRIAFVRIVSTGSALTELWSMRSDGSAKRRLVAALYGLQDLAWSPDGTKIAFLAASRPASTSSSSVSLWVVGADGGGLRQLTSFQTADPRWSPDGSLIAFAGREDSVYFDVPLHIGVVDASGAGLRWLTPTPAANDFQHSESAPSWSADGTEIAFVRSNALVVIRADGSGERTVTAETTNVGSPIPINSSQWSPRGDEIAFADDLQHELHLVHPDGSDPRTLAGDAGAYAWSPGGDRLVYVQSVPNATRTVLVVKPVGGRARFLPLPSARGSGVWGDPAWSPSGNSLYYAVKSLRDLELYSIAPHGGPRHQLTRNDVDDFDPAVSPDGRRIAFARGSAYGDSASSLYLMNANGTHVRRLTRTVAQDSAPSWAPDNTHLVFEHFSHERTELDVLDTRTRRIRTIVWEEATDPAWSPNGRRIAYASGGRIMLVRPGGWGVRNLLKGRNFDFAFWPTWSPNGRLIAFAAVPRGADSSEELIVSSSGGGLRWVACPFSDDSGNERVSWSPDGTALAGDVAGTLWVCPVSGSSPYPLATGIEPDWQPLH